MIDQQDFRPFYNQPTVLYCWKFDWYCWKFDPNGNIDWKINDCQLIWDALKGILNRKEYLTFPPSSIPEFDLIKKGANIGVAIISGVAGTGKSTLLSHYYQEIKKATPSEWAIRLNLADYNETLSELNASTTESAIQFFVNLPAVVGHSRFARSLLSRRLETGKRVVLMLDGLDEIDEKRQSVVIQLIQTISQGKLGHRIYITTRSHLNGVILQDKLHQFAYTLKNFRPEHQISYLFKFWRKNLKICEDELIKEFAISLVNRVSKKLNDKLREIFNWDSSTLPNPGRMLPRPASNDSK